MIVILNVLRRSQFSMYKYLYSETRFKCFSFLLGNFVGVRVLQPKNESTQNQEQSNSKLKSTPDNSNLQGKQKKVRVIESKII